MQPAFFGNGTRCVGAAGERGDSAVQADHDGRDGAGGGDGGEHRQPAGGGGIAGGEEQQEGDGKQRGQQPVHVPTSSAIDDTAVRHVIVESWGVGPSRSGRN